MCIAFEVDCGNEDPLEVCGRVCTFYRTSPKSVNVDILTRIHVWEKNDLN